MSARYEAKAVFDMAGPVQPPLAAAAASSCCWVTPQRLAEASSNAFTAAGRGTLAMPSASRSASDFVFRRSSAAHRATPLSTPVATRPSQNAPATSPFGRSAGPAASVDATGSVVGASVSPGAAVGGIVAIAATVDGAAVVGATVVGGGNVAGASISVALKGVAADDGL